MTVGVSISERTIWCPIPDLIDKSLRKSESAKKDMPRKKEALLQNPLDLPNRLNPVLYYVPISLNLIASYE